ncbi:hypothetical protein ACFW04_013777 [Cataglyphis niger]
MIGDLSHIYRHAESEAHIKIEKKTATKNMNENINMMDDSLLPFEERKKSAEIRYALIADKNIPYQTAKDVLNFFQQTGKNPNVLKSTNMGRTKCKNIISNVLCPIEADRVVNNIQNTKFSIFIDVTSDISNEKWMTFLKLNIPFRNIVALSCDNASVMTGKHLSFKKKLEEFCPNLLTFPCPCHSAALAAHAACAKISEYCKDFLKKIANYINSSPKHAAIYEEFIECFQETKRKIFKFSNTRWLSYHSCVVRLLDFWDTTKQFIISVMENPDIKAYLLFLKHIFNSLILLMHFFKLWKQKFTCCSQRSECEEYLENLMKKGHADIIENVRDNCLQFYVTAAEEISKRLSIKDKFLSKLTVFQFNTSLCSVDRETSFNDVFFVAQILGGFDENALKKEWNALHLDFTIVEKKHLSKLNFDEIWKEILKHTSLNIKCLLNAIRSLPNSNADPERTFSLLTDFKTKKRNKLSSACINASYVLKSALKARKKTILDMEINENQLSRMSSDKLYANCPKKKSILTLCAADNNIISYLVIISVVITSATNM